MSYLSRVERGLIVFAFMGAVFGSRIQNLAAKDVVGIEEALRIALSENPGLKAAAYNEAASKHRVGEARSVLLPAVALSAGYTRYEEPMSVTPIHQVGRFPALDEEIYDAGVGVNIPILSGRALSGIDLAKSAVEEASARRSTVGLEIMTSVAGVFIAGSELDDNLRLIEAHIEALQQRKRELESLRAEGRVSPAEMYLIEASINTAAADKIAVESRRKELIRRFGRLLGTEDSVEPKNIELNESAVTSHGEAGYREASGPAAMQAKALVEEAAYAKSSVIRSLWPELNGFAAYSWRAGSDQVFSGEWAVGMNLRVPLLDVARRWSSIKAADSTVEAARSRYRDAQIAEQTLAASYQEKQESLRNRRALVNLAAEAKNSSVSAFRERYFEGRLSLSELVVQETELLQLRMLERNLTYQRATTFIDYHAVRGSLTSELIESLMED